VEKSDVHPARASAESPLTTGETSPSPRLLSRQGIAREFRMHFPAWLVYITSVGMLHATLANVPEQLFLEAGIPRRAFAVTAFFPLAWFSLYFVLRIRRSKRTAKRWPAYLALAGLVLGVPLLVFFFYLPYPFTRAQMRALHESSAFLWTALLMIHVLAARGRQALAMLFGVGFVFGVLLENTGIIMGFFSEPGYFLYAWPLPAPLCTMASWSLVLAVVISVVDRLGEWLPWLSPSRGTWPRAAAATAMALCLDAQIDPLASLGGLFWRWNELLKPVFFGVPLVNFAAWFGAISVFSWFIYRARGHRDWGPGRRNRELLLRVPLACFLAWAVCFAVMAAAEGGFSGPSFHVLRSFVGRLLGA
jgi:hypothetical protein